MATRMALFRRARQSRQNFSCSLIVLWLMFMPALVFSQMKPGPLTRKIDLNKGWRLQSSCKMSASGAEISSPAFNPTEWHNTNVPSTVLAALVADGTYPDPYFGMNLRGIPGTTYPIGENFAHLPMPDDSPFKCSWWYRTQFTLPR